MKKIHLIITLACAAISSGAWAQTSPQTPATQSISTPPADGVLADPAITQRLQSDLSNRNTDLGNQSVDWFTSDAGYYGTYSIGDQSYMTTYDKDGKYQETMTKGDWNDTNVPANLKSSYDKSPYQSQQVKNYWTVTDPTTSGYYLELQNKDGKTSKVWADKNGKISKTRPKYSSTSGSARKSAPKQ